MTAQSAKGWQCKHEDLGSDLQNPHKNPAWHRVPVVLAVEAETGGLKFTPTKTMNSSSVRGPSSKKIIINKQNQ